MYDLRSNGNVWSTRADCYSFTPALTLIYKCRTWSVMFNLHHPSLWPVIKVLQSIFLKNIDTTVTGTTLTKHSMATKKTIRAITTGNSSRSIDLDGILEAHFLRCLMTMMGSKWGHWRALCMFTYSVIYWKDNPSVPWVIWQKMRELEWCVQTLQYQVGQSIQTESHFEREENIDYHNVNSTSIKQGGEEVKESLNHNSHKSFLLGLAQECKWDRRA